MSFPVDGLTCIPSGCTDSGPFKISSMRYLLLLLIGSVLFACNSSDTTSKEKAADSLGVKKDTPAADTTMTDTLPLPAPEPVKEQPAVAVSACAGLALFQPGAEIVTAVYNEKGEEMSKQKVKVLNVKEKNGISTANCVGQELRTGATENDAPAHFEYQCDGKSIFFSISSLFNQDKKKKEAGVSASLISFPIAVKEGQTLPDARGFINSTKGDKQVSMKYAFRNRKVGAREKVTTPAGTFNCYPVSNNVEVELDLPGVDEKAKEMMKQMQKIMKMSMTTWISPELGIVKMEMYVNGELKSRNEVIEVKR